MTFFARCIAVVLLCAVPVVGCSTESDADPLSGITGDDMCGMVDIDAVEDELNLESGDEPRADFFEKSGKRVNVRCDWFATDTDGDGVSIETRLDFFEGESDPADALDQMFSTLPYDDVPGLGDMAGYMYEPNPSGMKLPWSQLTVALDLDGNVVSVMIAVWRKEATEDQLRSIMERVLPEVEARLSR